MNKIDRIEQIKFEIGAIEFVPNEPLARRARKYRKLFSLYEELTLLRPDLADRLDGILRSLRTLLRSTEHEQD